MDPASEGCRLCLDGVAECFTTIANPQLKDQMEKVFCFSIEPKQGYWSGVCQSCSYAISEFYQYSEKVRQNQEVLNGTVTNCDPTEDSKITLEIVKCETLSDSGLPETTEDYSKSKDEIAGGVSNSNNDELNEPPPRESQPTQNGRTAKRKLDDLIGFHVLHKDSRQDSSTGPFKCERCPQSFAQESALAEHMDWHRKFKCPKCNIMVPATSLKKHMKKQHSGQNQTMACDTCGKEFRDKKCLDRHMNEHVEIEVLQVQCGICQCWLKDAKGLRYHMTRVHANVKRDFECDICLQKYPHARSLAMHKSRTHAEPKHECEFCGKMFKVAVSLKEHRATHTGEEVQRFQCEICQRWLKGSRNFRNHMNWTHNDSTQEFQCDICLKKYPHFRALQCHKLHMHTEPKHECEFCGKKFKVPRSLKEHRTIHTGVALYSCEYCGISKSSRQNLQHHIKRHHPTEIVQKNLMATQNSDPS